MVNELKRELSSLSGVDFFNPKYRNVFKKYFPNDNTSDGTTDEEKEKFKNLVGEEFEDDEVNDDVDSNDIDEEGLFEEESSTEESSDKKNDDVTSEEADKNAEANDIDKTEEIENSETDTASNLTSENITESSNDEANDVNSELIDTKIELELVKAGVRSDRLDVAKKLIKSEIHGLEDLGRVAELIKMFPEWLKSFQKSEATPFGITLGNNANDLTAEERRLKEVYGVDPR